MRAARHGISPLTKCPVGLFNKRKTMYIMPQGQNLAPKVKELEKRVEMLENAIRELKSDKPRMGRPPKDKNGTNRVTVDNPSRD